MKATRMAFWMVLLVAAQAALAERIALGRIAPDFLALLAVFVALEARPREAFAIGAFVGLAHDMLSSDRLGPMAVSLALACVLLVIVRPRHAEASGATAAAATALTVLVANLGYGLFRVLGWGGPAMDNPLGLALAIAAFTAPVALVVLPAMARESRV